MSRQEAAIIYLDTMLGFRGAYKEFTEAVETLNEAERSLIEMKSTGGSQTHRERKGVAFFIAM